MKVQEKSSCLMVSNSFCDVDELNQLLNNYREVQVEPLSLEPFQGNFYQVDFQALTVIFAEVLTPVNLRGERRSGYTQFGVFLQFRSEPVVHQQSVDIDTLCGFDPSRGSDNIYPQNTLIGEVQVRQYLLESTLISINQNSDRPISMFGVGRICYHKNKPIIVGY
jgi:hypothetical protein